MLEIIQSGLEGEELEDAVYGELSLLPSEVDKRFAEILKESGSKAATEWLYNYCVCNKYVKKDVLDKNPRFDTENGLTITINKAKPEFRDPKKAKAGNSVEGGFAKCVICRENEGFGTRNKRNLRTVSISLSGTPWFWQYSPFGYFPEHGIAVNCEHIPMHIDRGTLENLLDFVDKFPHYYIGCNAPLERIGGSVLAHDHYQGGNEILPINKARIRTKIKDKKYPYVTVGILDWAGTVIRIKSDKRNEIIDITDRLCKAWVNYNNIELGIIAKDKNGEVFHAHPEYHAIKKESIGLIEAQGLFILPGRLEEQLDEIEKIIVGKSELPHEYAEFKLVYEETKALYESGKYADIHKAMQEELGSICERILENTAVFKKEEDCLKFLQQAGFEV